MTLALGMSFERTNCHHNLATQPPSSVLPPLSVDYVSRYPSWLVLMWSISKCFSVSLSCISLISLIFWSMSELPGAGKVQFIILHFLVFAEQSRTILVLRATRLTLASFPGSHASINTQLVEQRTKHFLSVPKTLVLFDYVMIMWEKILGSSNVHMMLTPTEHIHVYVTLWQWPQSTKSMDLIGYSNILPW